MKEKETKDNGWIMLHRKSIASSVWKNPTIWMVWCWCLLKANHTKHKFPFNDTDIEINTGEFVTGRNKALKELRTLTPQKYRTAIKYLKSTNRITIKSNNKFSIIKINKWNEYQCANQLTNKPLTSKQPASNQQITTYNNDKNDNNEKKKSNGVFTPPSLSDVTSYITDKGYTVDPVSWFDFYTSKGWMIGKNKMKDWQAAVRTCARRDDGASASQSEDAIIKQLKQKYEKK